MSNVNPWQFDLEGYLREAEPDAAERADAWQTGIGLQAVDGLPVSDYLLGTAKEHIEGNITIDEAQRYSANSYLFLDWLQHEGSAVNQQDTDQVRALLAALGVAELSARELMSRLGLSHRPTCRQNYLNPALAAGLIERTIPDKPTSRLQRYRRDRRNGR